MFGDDVNWLELDDVEANERSFSQMAEVTAVLSKHSWLAMCEEIAQREGFFHWELDFAPVFGNTGFDLQIGNPPWVRPDWDDAPVLADLDPWFGLADRAATDVFRERRKITLKNDYSHYLDERASVSGTSSHLKSSTDRPVLATTRPDLYRCFIDRAWRNASSLGVIGLIHPGSHFSEKDAAALRGECFLRLRRYWHFQNELNLFEDPDHKEEFSVNIYSGRGDRVPTLRRRFGCSILKRWTVHSSTTAQAQSLASRPLTMSGTLLHTRAG